MDVCNKNNLATNILERKKNKTLLGADNKIF